MISQNTDKKALVEKLVQDKVITLDQAILLLQEDETPQDLSTPIQWPFYLGGPWWGIYPPYPYQQLPTYPTVHWIGSGVISSGDCTIVTNYADMTVTSTAHTVPCTYTRN